MKEGERDMDALRAEIGNFLGLGEPVGIDDPVVLDSVQGAGFFRKLISYRIPDGDVIQAFLFEPEAPMRTAVLALHQHNSQWEIGKSEIAGLAGDPLQAFGPALARAGVMVLAPDAVGFESRAGIGTDAAGMTPPLSKPGSTAEGWLQYFNHMAHRLVHGELLMTKVLGDAAAAVTMLRKLSQTDRVGVIGHSYGGNIALFAAALDPRIAFACASGAACSYRYKLAHGIGLEMALIIPGFAMRFDLGDLMRCVAPRKLLIVSSDDDPLTADAADLVARARPAFSAKAAAKHLRHLHVSGGHALDPQRFTAITDWVMAQKRDTSG